MTIVECYIEAEVKETIRKTYST